MASPRELLAAAPGSEDRPVPYDLGAEVALLGALVLDRDTIVHVEATLTGADFYRAAHGLIYDAAVTLYRRREPPDTQTLASELHRRGHLEAAGGVAYLAHLMATVPTAVHAEHYAASIRAASIRRGLIATGGRIAGLGYEEARDLPDVMDEAERLLHACTQRVQRGTPQTDHAAVWEYLGTLRSEDDAPAPVRAWGTGLPGLDDLTGGCRPSRLWVVTGESGGGKSTLQQAIGLALKAQGAALGFISLEMDAAELAERALAALSGIDSAVLRAGRLQPAERAAVNAAGQVLLTQAPIRLITGGGLSLRDVQAQARRWAAEGGLDVLILDYLQLVRLPGRDKVSELDDLANGLKALAMELDICLITASQLSRTAIGREAREWDDHLRGSGAIKHAADVVLAVAPREERPTDGTAPWRVQLAVTKHRGGPVGDVDALWWPAYSRIGEVTRRYA